MVVDLGTTPETMRLKLTRGSDFMCVLVNVSRTWPTGASVRIEVAGQSWQATVAGVEATFAVDKAAVETAMDQKPSSFKLFYVDPTGVDLLWAKGPVVMVE